MSTRFLGSKYFSNLKNYYRVDIIFLQFILLWKGIAMNKTEMIKELRELTSAGMNDCREAIEQSDGDLQKAIDLIKTKGLNIADGRSGRATSEGMVCSIYVDDANVGMVEVNCQTDFVANSPAFKQLTHVVRSQMFLDITNNGGLFKYDDE